jgi:hypothetical protein
VNASLGCTAAACCACGGAEVGQAAPQPPSPCSCAIAPHTHTAPPPRPRRQQVRCSCRPAGQTAPWACCRRRWCAAALPRRCRCCCRLLSPGALAGVSVWVLCVCACACACARVCACVFVRGARHSAGGRVPARSSLRTHWRCCRRHHTRTCARVTPPPPPTHTHTQPAAAGGRERLEHREPPAGCGDGHAQRAHALPVPAASGRHHAAHHPAAAAPRGCVCGGLCGAAMLWCLPTAARACVHVRGHGNALH